MINFYNEKLAPQMLCQLLHDVVPYRFHRPVIFSYGHKHMLKEHERSQGVTNHRCIWLNLEAIAFNGGNSCSIQAGIWRRMLFVGFHEFAHIFLPYGNAYRYKHDWNYHSYIEGQATAKAEDWIARILANDGRLYQPKYLGIVDIVRRQEQEPLKTISKGSYFCRRLKDYRCYVTGGQLSVMDVAHKLLERDKTVRQRIRLIHKFGNDLARIHIDHAGRRHHFWVWGDLPIIAQRLTEKEAK